MSEFIDKSEAVGEGYLQDWYISSVVGDVEPVWTEAHIEELAKDFIVIPKDTPGSDVVPVVHGEWRDQYNDFTNAKCSCCGATLEVMIDGEANRLLWDGFKQFYKFCPNCGAKMDENEVENLKRCSCGDRHYCPEVEKDKNGKWFIRCHMCHKIVWGNTIEETVNAWNEGAKTDDET